jgi:hypothetical protein
MCRTSGTPTCPPAIWTIQPRRAVAQVSPTTAPAPNKGSARGVATASVLIGAHSTMGSARPVAGKGRSFLAPFGLGEEGDREGGDRRGVDGDRER